MAIQKQTVTLNFQSGLDTKTDPFQLPLGKFLQLSNMVFQKGKRLQKRNGFPALTSLSDTTNTYLTTFNGNLTALGTSLSAYSQASNTWVNQGVIEPLKLSTLPLIRSNQNQSQADSVVSESGLVCTVFTDNVSSGGSTTPAYKYVIADAETGQNIVSPRVIPVASGTVTGAARVFLLGNYFVIVFTNVITATNHLQYVAISISNPTSVTANTDLSALYTPASGLNFDGVVANNTLYLAWNGSDGGGAIRMTYLDSSLTQHGTKVFAGKDATVMSVCADTSQSTPVIYAAFYTTTATSGYALAVTQDLTTIFAPTLILNAGTVANITCTATGMVLSIFYEFANTYSYGASLATNLIKTVNVTQAGSVGSTTTILRSVGLASKAFIFNSVSYFLTAYSSPQQPTYFLSNASGKVIAKLAYQNGGGYLTKGLPNISVIGNTVSIAYLMKDLIAGVNKTQGTASSAAVYSQTGINLVRFVFQSSSISTAEIGSDLQFSGGFLWMYDGYSPVEQGFHLYPDNVIVTTSTSGGSLTDQTYYYVATYEWSDNQGNVFRSAPSIPVAQVTTGGNTSTNTIKVPTLRLTLKTSNAVKICLYRWSTAQQTYYQVTSLSIPTLNSLTTDNISITDTFADSSIIGNNILYTTGGVVENIAAPSTSIMTLFRSRLFLVDAEDPNLLWYSKQVIESTPAEMSDLFTIFVAPTIGAQGNTGPISSLSSIDDKLIIFKQNAIYYLVGNGPDNTGANNDFSEPVFVTSTIGCTNQNSIVFMPNGLMFQSDKGIWLLGRDLSTSYIGAPVEDFTLSSLVQSAVNVPGTNEVRFTLDSGIMLVYDYYFGQWATFENIPAISSTLYQGLHTYLNEFGQVFQESPGTYLDGSSPVLMKFKTSWINPASLQGYQRAYFFYLLGTYLSPHQLRIQIAYDYQDSAVQVTMITPDNYNGAYGSETIYGGGSPFGGTPSLEQDRIFFAQQKCEAFQITIEEIYDSSHGGVAGAGLTLSGLDLVVGVKSTYPRLPSTHQAG